MTKNLSESAGLTAVGKLVMLWSHCKLAVSLSLPLPSELMIEGFTFSTKPAVTIATAEATAREMTQHLAFSVSSLDLTPLQHEKNDRSVK